MTTPGQVPFLAPPDGYIEGHLSEVAERECAGNLERWRSGTARRLVEGGQWEAQARSADLSNLAQAMRKAVDPASALPARIRGQWSQADHALMESKARTVVKRTAEKAVDPLEYAPPIDGLVRWFTFGQSHVHRVGGFIYDCDVVVCIIALDPRAVMVSTFGDKWAGEYDTLPDMQLHPRGVKMIVAVGYPCPALPVAGDNSDIA